MVKSSALRCVAVGCNLALIILATFVHGSPMMYKQNDQKNYEAGEDLDFQVNDRQELINNLIEPLDLIPVSSTVIPLNVYEVSYGTKDGKLNDEEYKKVYLKNFHKKVQHQVGEVDKLVTGEFTFQEVDLICTYWDLSYS